MFPIVANGELEITATVIGVTRRGDRGGKPIYEPTGQRFDAFASPNDWVATKQKAGVVVTNANGKILVPSLKKWAAFEETANGEVILSVMEIS